MSQQEETPVKEITIRSMSRDGVQKEIEALMDIPAVAHRISSGAGSVVPFHYRWEPSLRSSAASDGHVCCRGDIGTRPVSVSLERRADGALPPDPDLGNVGAFELAGTLRCSLSGYRGSRGVSASGSRLGQVMGSDHCIPGFAG